MISRFWTDKGFVPTYYTFYGIIGMKRILLCPPDHYDIEYEINPWMHVENKVDQRASHESYNLLKNLYTTLGVEIYEIPQGVGLPDMVYTANFGFVKDEKFVAASFKFPQRRAESLLASTFLKQKFGYETVSLPEGIFYEGQGDLLSDGNRFFFGWGKRSDREAKPYLESALDADLIDFELVDPYYYHLDTCFAPLTSELVVMNPRSFTPHGKKQIHELFTDVIETSEEDNHYLACNLVHVGEDIVVGKGVTQTFKDALTAHGYRVHEIPMAEYLKGGGSVKCCSFEF